MKKAHDHIWQTVFSSMEENVLLVQSGIVFAMKKKYPIGTWTRALLCANCAKRISHFTEVIQPQSPTQYKLH